MGSRNGKGVAAPRVDLSVDFRSTLPGLAMCGFRNADWICVNDDHGHAPAAHYMVKAARLGLG